VAPFIKDPDPGTRYCAVRTSGKIDAPAEFVLDGLIAVLEEPLPRVLRKDSRPATKRMALLQIRKFGREALRALPSVRALKYDHHVSEEAEETLSVLGRAVK
jgi:hypothetical protein